MATGFTTRRLMMTEMGGGRRKRLRREGKTEIGFVSIRRFPPNLSLWGGLAIRKKFFFFTKEINMLFS